jgi:hypothetical protein
MQCVDSVAGPPALLSAVLALSLWAGVIVLAIWMLLRSF